MLNNAKNTVTRANVHTTLTPITNIVILNSKYFISTKRNVATRIPIDLEIDNE